MSGRAQREIKLDTARRDVLGSHALGIEPDNGRVLFSIT